MFTIHLEEVVYFLGTIIVEQSVHFLQIVDPGFLGIGPGVPVVKIGLQQGNQIRGFRFGQFSLYLFQPLNKSGNLLSDIPDCCVGCLNPAVELALLCGNALALHRPDSGAFVNSGQQIHTLTLIAAVVETDRQSLFFKFGVTQFRPRLPPP